MQFCCWGFCPMSAPLADGVCEDEQLSDAGDEGLLVGLASTREAAVVSNQRTVPALGCGQRGIEESPADAAATAIDVALAGAFSRVVVKGGDANQGRDTFAADLAELGQQDDKGQGGADADAVDAFDQLEPRSEIVLLAHRGLQADQLSLAAPFASLDVTIDLLEDPLVGKALATALEASDIGLDLLDEEQLLGKRRQPGIGRFMQAVELGGALGNESGIDAVVLGSTQLVDRKGTDLARLQLGDFEAVCAQVRHNVSFVAAGGFDADAGNLALRQPGRQRPMSVAVVGHA